MSVIFIETNEWYSCHGISKSLKRIVTILWLKVNYSDGMEVPHFRHVVTSKREVDLDEGCTEGD